MKKEIIYNSEMVSRRFRDEEEEGLLGRYDLPEFIQGVPRYDYWGYISEKMYLFLWIILVLSLFLSVRMFL